jgi:pimeloyl-ACP methyl ester carboxylesterase
MIYNRGREDVVGGNRPDTEKRETIVLVHGLWMTGKEMRVLGGRLEESGFLVRYFRYRSWRGGLAQAADALREFVEGTDAERVHLVGHSLGGIVIARMLEEAPVSRQGRVAMLGVPMGGSAAARIMSRRRVGRWLVGGVIREGIVERAPKWAGGRELLVIAGDIPLGSGLLLGLKKRRRSADDQRSGVARRSAPVPESGRASFHPFPLRVTLPPQGVPIVRGFAQADGQTGFPSGKLLRREEARGNGRVWITPFHEPKEETAK